MKRLSLYYRLLSSLLMASVIFACNAMQVPSVEVTTTHNPQITLKPLGYICDCGCKKPAVEITMRSTLDGIVRFFNRTYDLQLVKDCVATCGLEAFVRELGKTLTELTKSETLSVRQEKDECIVVTVKKSMTHQQQKQFQILDTEGQYAFIRGDMGHSQMMRRNVRLLERVVPKTVDQLKKLPQKKIVTQRAAQDDTEGLSTLFEELLTICTSSRMEAHRNRVRDALAAQGIYFNAHPLPKAKESEVQESRLTSSLELDKSFVTTEHLLDFMTALECICGYGDAGITDLLRLVGTTLSSTQRVDGACARRLLDILMSNNFVQKLQEALCEKVPYAHVIRTKDGQSLKLSLTKVPLSKKEMKEYLSCTRDEHRIRFLLGNGCHDAYWKATMPALIETCL